MLHQRPQPLTGIDAPLAKLQQDFYERMRGVWSLKQEDWECYPRAYRNRLADGYVAEVQTKRGEYRDVYQDDGKAIVSFFGIGQTQTLANGLLNASLHLVMFTHLTKLKPHSVVRPDEEVRMDVFNYFWEGSGWGFNLTGFVTGVEACLEEYPGSRRKQLLSKADMHPHHLFRCNLSLAYRP